jgi:transposase
LCHSIFDRVSHWPFSLPFTFHAMAVTVRTILSLHAEGFSIRGISQTTHTSHHRVRAVIAANAEGLELSNLHGAPRKDNPMIEERIAVLTQTDASLSNRMISQIIQEEMGITLSRKTVRSVRLKHCYRFAKPRRCQLLTMDHIHMRLQFEHDFEGPVFLELRKHPFAFTNRDSNAGATHIGFAGSMVSSPMQRWLRRRSFPE